MVFWPYVWAWLDTVASFGIGVLRLFSFSPLYRRILKKETLCGSIVLQVSRHGSPPTPFYWVRKIVVQPSTTRPAAPLFRTGWWQVDRFLFLFWLILVVQWSTTKLDFIWLSRYSLRRGAVGNLEVLRWGDLLAKTRHAFHSSATFPYFFNYRGLTLFAVNHINASRSPVCNAETRQVECSPALRVHCSCVLRYANFSPAVLFLRWLQPQLSVWWLWN